MAKQIKDSKIVFYDMLWEKLLSQGSTKLDKSMSSEKTTDSLTTSELTFSTISLGLFLHFFIVMDEKLVSLHFSSEISAKQMNKLMVSEIALPITPYTGYYHQN